MREAKELFENAIKGIDITTDIFYQQQDQEGYKSFESTLRKVTLVVDYIFEQKNKDDTIETDEKKIIDILTGGMRAMEQRDTILLSDILQYELKEELQNLMEILT